MNPMYILPPYFFIIPFNIIFSFTGVGIARSVYATGYRLDGPGSISGRA
jgi:hypothetical protein